MHDRFHTVPTNGQNYLATEKFGGEMNSDYRDGRCLFDCRP
jgi:hypothetical protein